MPYLDRVAGGWKVRWREGGRGSPLLASRVFASEPKAQDFADDLAARLAARKALSKSRAHGAPLPFNEITARWAAGRLAARAISPAYAARVQADLRRTAKGMGWATVADITPAEVDRWRSSQDGKNARLGAYLRSVLRYADERLQQPVPERTWVALRPPRTRRRPKAALPSAVDLKRWQRTSDACSASAGALVHCLATYGWRPITAARLLVGDVDLRRGTVTLRGLKGGGDSLRHPLLPATMRRLRALVKGRAADEPLFIDPRSGKGWDHATGSPITDWWRVHVEPARGIYDLKRHAISTMLARGLAPQDVALFTGHRSLSQVLVYARTNEERARDALKLIGAKAPTKPAKKGRAAIARREHGDASDGGMARSGSA